MGCGASVKACTEEEAKAVCIAMSKEVMKDSVKYAMCEATEEIKLVAPEQVSKMRKDIAELRSTADKAKDGGEEKPEGGGGMLGAIGGMVKSAADTVQGAAGSVMGMALNAIADKLEEAIDKLDASFTDIGKDIVKKKQEEALKVFFLYIGNMKILIDPIGLVRGEKPFKQEQYDAAPKDACSKCLMDRVDSSLTFQLLGAVGEAIEEHTAVKAWRDAINNYNSGADQINGLGSDLKITKIELNIEEYICEQVIKEILRLMQIKEAQMRKNPEASGTQYPEVFQVVFSGQRIMKPTYDKYVEQAKTAKY